MNTRSSLKLLSAAVLCSTSVVPAADAPSGTPATGSPSTAGLLNDYLRQTDSAFSTWDIGGQGRARFEHREYFAAPGVPGAVDFARTGDSENNFLLLREKLHVGYNALPWMSAFVEARDSSSIRDDRNPNPEADSIDLHQAFLRLGDPKEFPITAKIGRQELIYGDERLIGASDWTNVERTFDAARLRFENDFGWVDAFVSRPVLVDDNNFNRSNEHDNFSGIYASSRKLMPWQETQFYVLSRDTSGKSATAIGVGLPPLLTGATPRDIVTIGTRMKSLPAQFNGFDYGLEVAAQFGTFNSPITKTRLEHRAFASHIEGGYTFEQAWSKPRIALEHNFASGDRGNGRHETFDNLFPTNHKFYGMMDFVSWENIQNPGLTLTAKPLKNLTISCGDQAFWRAEKTDYFYQVNGAPRTSGGYGINPGAGKYLGNEIDLVASYTIKPYALAQAGYGHFFVGDFEKNSLAARGDAADANFVYLQLTLNF